MTSPALAILEIASEEIQTFSLGSPETRQMLFESWQIEKRQQADCLLNLDMLESQIIARNSGV